MGTRVPPCTRYMTRPLLPHLHQAFHRQVNPDPAPAYAHRGEAIPLHGLWQELQPQLPSQAHSWSLSCAHHPLSPPPEDSGDKAKEAKTKKWTLLALAAEPAIEIPNPCPECWQSFSQSSDLVKQAHAHPYGGEKPFCCSHCGKRFSVSSNLTRHQRIHTGEKPYTCDTCDKHSTDKSTLTQHQRTHTGEKPYTCIYGGKSFSHSSHHKRHERSHNAGDSSQSSPPPGISHHRPSNTVVGVMN